MPEASSQDPVFDDIDESEFDEHSLKGTVATKQEAYDRCADKVVAVLKCVDAHGPTWAWNCSGVYVDLQRCYDTQRQRDNSGIEDAWKMVTESVTVRWERLRWSFQDMFYGGKKD